MSSGIHHSGPVNNSILTTVQNETQQTNEVSNRVLLEHLPSEEEKTEEPEEQLTRMVRQFMLESGTQSVDQRRQDLQEQFVQVFVQRSPQQKREWKLQLVDHPCCKPGDIELVESSFITNSDYRGHQQFFPFDTPEDIDDTMKDDFRFLSDEVQEALSQLIAFKCAHNHIVMVGFIKNIVTVYATKKPA